MDIITLEGEILARLIEGIRDRADSRIGWPIHTLRVARDGDGVKVKINEGVWSPGYQLAAEDVARLARKVGR